MTATQANTTTCPECNAADSIDLAGGLRLCLQCRNEWNPAHVQATPPPPPAPTLVLNERGETVAAILHSDTADDVLRGPADDEAHEAHDEVHDDDDDEASEYLGQWGVTNDTDTLYLCIGTYASGVVDLQAENGNVRTGVDPAGLTWYGDEPPTLRAHDGADDDTSEPLVGVIATIASLVLTTGVASVGDDEDRTLLNPPTGWLPSPASDIPEAEQGAAYAVAILVRTFNLDTVAVLAIAQSLMAGASASTTESE